MSLTTPALTQVLTHEGSTMRTATWNGVVLAESDETSIVEGNHYFPPASVKPEYFEAIDHATTCPWKGTSSYYDIVVNGERNPSAVWYYPAPKDAAAEIKDHVAFYGSVSIAD